MDGLEMTPFTLLFFYFPSNQTGLVWWCIALIFSTGRRGFTCCRRPVRLFNFCFVYLRQKIWTMLVLSSDTTEIIAGHFPGEFARSLLAATPNSSTFRSTMFSRIMTSQLRRFTLSWKTFLSGTSSKSSQTYSSPTENSEYTSLRLNVQHFDPLWHFNRLNWSVQSPRSTGTSSELWWRPI